MPTAGELVSQGFGGYQGWGDAEANANFTATGGAGKQTQPSGGSSSNNNGGSSSGGGQNPGSLQNYLDTYQKQLSDLFGGDVAAKTNAGQPIGFTDIKSAIAPTTAYPAPLDRTAAFDAYRQVYGIDKLEANMNDLKAQKDALAAQTRTNVSAEQGKPVATNVISGRVSEQTYQAQQQMDFIDRQLTTTNDQLTTAYNVVNMYMNFKNLDYQDAVTAYNTQFTQNLDTINLMRGVQGDARATIGLEIQGQQLVDTEKQQAIDNARANLQIYTNAITSGNLDPKNLSADQQTQLNKLEVQSGLPVGFISGLNLAPKDRIVFTNTSNGVTQVGVTDASGNITVKNYGTRTPTPVDKKTQEQSYVIDAMNSLKGSDGYVSPATFNTAKAAWVQRGGDATTFTSQFGQYVNPTHAKDYGVSDVVANPEKYKSPALDQYGQPVQAAP